MFTDKAYYTNLDNIKRVQSGIAGDANILTKEGYVPAKELDGKTVELWIGDRWAEYKVSKSPEKKTVRKVSFSNGASFYVEPHHRFILSNKERVMLRDIRNNELLANPNRMPLIHARKAEKGEAHHGFDNRIETNHDSKEEEVFYFEPVDFSHSEHMVVEGVLICAYGGKLTF